MAALNQLRNTIISKFSLQNSGVIQRLPSLVQDSPRSFSADAGQPLESSPAPFGQSPITGACYGKLMGNNKLTLKTDIISYLEGCDLTLVDVKVDYNRFFMPMGMMVRFHSRSAYEQAEAINRKGRLYKFERAQSAQWDALTAYNGKTVILQGIPRNALPDDIDRFLSGYDYDASSMEFINRPGFPDPMRMAVVRFPSQAQAMNLSITRNRNFCLNNQILIRVLQ